MTAREERRAKERAKIALIAALAPVVDLSTLTDGEHGFDYSVTSRAKTFTSSWSA
jgi:hypothetical protein